MNIGVILHAPGLAGDDTVVPNSRLKIFKLGHYLQKMSIGVEDTSGYFSFMVENVHGGMSDNNQLHLVLEYKFRKNISEDTYTDMVEIIFKDIEDQANKARMDMQKDDEIVVGTRWHSTSDGEQNSIRCRSDFRLEKDPSQRDVDFLFNNSRVQALKGIEAAKTHLRSLMT